MSSQKIEGVENKMKEAENRLKLLGWEIEKKSRSNVVFQKNDDDMSMVYFSFDKKGAYIFIETSGYITFEEYQLLNKWFNEWEAKASY